LYTRSRPKEKKKVRRKRQREEAAAREQQAQQQAETDAATVRVHNEMDAVDEFAATDAGGGPTERADGIRGRVRHSALADALEEDEDEAEAQRADDEPMLSAHGYDLSIALKDVRRRLCEFLAEQVEAEKSVPMQQTPKGVHPTMRWTIKFGKRLARR
jgi:hypothetical protein